MSIHADHLCRVYLGVMSHIFRIRWQFLWIAWYALNYGNCIYTVAACTPPVRATFLSTISVCYKKNLLKHRWVICDEKKN